MIHYKKQTIHSSECLYVYMFFVGTPLITEIILDAYPHLSRSDHIDSMSTILKCIIISFNFTQLFGIFYSKSKHIFYYLFLTNFSSIFCVCIFSRIIITSKTILAFEQLARALFRTIETRNIPIECRNSSTFR